MVSANPPVMFRSTSRVGPRALARLSIDAFITIVDMRFGEPLICRDGCSQACNDDECWRALYVCMYLGLEVDVRERVIRVRNDADDLTATN